MGIVIWVTLLILLAVWAWVIYTQRSMPILLLRDTCLGLCLGCLIGLWELTQPIQPPRPALAYYYLPIAAAVLFLGGLILTYVAHKKALPATLPKLFKTEQSK